MKWMVVLLLSCFAASVRGDTAWSGYLKSFAVAQDGIRIGPFKTPRQYQSQNSVRLMVNHFEDNSVFQLHYEVSPVFSSRESGFDSATLATTGGWRLTDPASTLSNDGKNRVLQNLDRLNVQFQLDAGDLTIGRQPITFGMARIINPTDVFLPFDVRTFNQEYRFGVDAVRFQHAFGQLSELDVGVIVGDGARADTSAAFLQVRTNVDGHDLQFALTRFAGQSLAGGGIQTALGDFGFWAEVAGVTGDEDYVRASTGFDYAFTENAFGMIEYHYNGAGAKDPADYGARFDATPYQVGGVFLLGRHYLIPAFSLQVSPLVSLQFQSLLNLDDQSSFSLLAAAYNVAENCYMDFGLYGFSGTGIDGPPPTLGSEYGGNPTTFYVSLKYYF